MNVLYFERQREREHGYGSSNGERSSVSWVVRTRERGFLYPRNRINRVCIPISDVLEAGTVTELVLVLVLVLAPDVLYTVLIQATDQVPFVNSLASARLLFSCFLMTCLYVVLSHFQVLCSVLPRW